MEEPKTADWSDIKQVYRYVVTQSDGRNVITPDFFEYDEEVRALYPGCAFTRLPTTMKRIPR